MSLSGADAAKCFEVIDFRSGQRLWLRLAGTNTAGITTEHSAIRHALNLESVITYEGTETVHQLVIGRELTGINAF